MTAVVNGPWKTITGPGGQTAPFYVIRFDKRGVCTSPSSLAHLVRASAQASDVFLFSHGWNNDWAGATSRYEEFIEQFVRMRGQEWEPPTRDFRPVLAGVHWPSTVLVPRDERGPLIAGGEPGANVDADGDQDLELIAEHLQTEQATRFYELAEKPELAGAEALELATLLAPVLAGPADELGTGPEVAPAPEELVRLWATIPADREPPAGQASTGETTAGQAPTGPTQGGGGFIDDVPADSGPAEPEGDPQAAGWLEKLDPRNAIRSATVLLMKDRAGRVGGTGVRTMLHGILQASPTSRVHLVGHSYGAKVVLSALAAGSAPSRPVESVLLLQPATSAKCFAEADGTNPAGGYRPALDRAKQPIMTTFSRHDVPLTRLFHLAARRASDKREAVIAGAPSEYAALGGFGPQDTASVTVVDARTAPERYQRATSEVLAIRADTVISGHGDVQNPATAWALLCQVME